MESSSFWQLLRLLLIACIALRFPTIRRSQSHWHPSYVSSINFGQTPLVKRRKKNKRAYRFLKLAEQMRIVVNHGMSVRYYHDYIGVNSRLDSMQAAILDIKLKHLNEYNEARQKAATFYNNAFNGNQKIKTPIIADYTTHVFHQYTLVLNGVDREGLMAHLADKGVASAVYYPVPLHMQKAYIDPRYNEGDFPVTEMLSKSVLSLPIHTELTPEIQKEITDALLEYVNS